MDRVGQAVVHGIARVRHDRTNKFLSLSSLSSLMIVTLYLLNNKQNISAGFFPS